MRTCLECKHWRWDSAEVGYSDYTPGGDSALNKTSSSQIYDPFTQFGIAPFEEPVVPEPLADDYPNCPMFMAVPSDMVRLIVLHCKGLIDAANARADKAESTMAPRRKRP